MTYEQFCKKVGGLIRLYRNKKKLKQGDLANLLDVDYQHIQKLENGKNLPLFYNMLRIVEFLDIPGNKIFSKDDDLDLQELSKKYGKYKSFIEAMNKSKELRDLVKHYAKNSEKFKDINLISAMESIAKLSKNKK